MNDATISRITVEQEADWLRVQENFTKGLQASMETRLASLPGGKEGPAAKEVRKELEYRLRKVTEETFRIAAPNLRVNGQEYEKYVEAKEPFDETLDRSLKGIHAEQVVWEGKVVEARRKVPARVNELLGKIADIEEHGEWAPEEDVQDYESAAGSEIPKPPRYSEAVDTFNTVASNLSELVQSAPTQLARAQRAHGVREEIANMGS